MAWDRWARKLRDRRYRATARSGEAVTARLVETEIEYARDLGMKPTELHTEIADRMRAGLSVAEAVAQITGPEPAPPPERLPAG